MTVSLIIRTFGTPSFSARRNFYLSVGTVLLYLLIVSSDFLSAIIFYFAGTPEHVHSDMVVGWGLAFIFAIAILYSSGIHSWTFEMNWQKKTLKELEGLKISFCSGISWLPWVRIPMKPAGIKADYWIWFLMGLIIPLGVLTDKLLNIITPSGVLGVNSVLSLILYQLIHPDIGFLVVLWLGLVGIYFSQRMCIRKFNTEKEKWVRELM
jgi:hypothetical protein